MKFEVGAWVTMKDHSYEGYVGYIIDRNPNTNNYHIQLHRDKSGKTFKYSRIECWSNEEFIVPLEPEIEYDPFLIDLALDMKDSDWFLSLSQNFKKGE